MPRDHRCCTGDPNEPDNDNDGTCDFEDPDDDNDGYPDTCDPDQMSAPSDPVENLQAYVACANIVIDLPVSPSSASAASIAPVILASGCRGYDVDFGIWIGPLQCNDHCDHHTGLGYGYGVGVSPTPSNGTGASVGLATGC